MHDLKSSEGVYQYGDIFAVRGQLYHRAMQLYPDARTNEFLKVIDKAQIEPGMTVVDVPSGGAYIARYLENVDLIGLEPSLVFAEFARENNQNVVLFENDLVPLQDASVDRVLSIAGLHHIENKGFTFSEMKRILRPGGRVVVADVAEDSAVRRFLDEFVGAHNDTGHSGWYFGDHTGAELSAVGLNVLEDKYLNYLWCAEDINHLAEFCRLLFGMTKTDRSTVAEAIQDYLGVRKMHGQTGLRWQLRCFVCNANQSGEFHP